MDLKDLKTLIKTITETDITEFDLETGDDKIHIKRGPDKEIIQVAAPVAAAPGVTGVPAAPVAPAVAPSQEAAAPADSPYDSITAPMVGSFYRKPAPDADVFCKVGDIIEAGQVICLIEAMKLFNEIEAEFKCRIVEILKEDGNPVEFGENIFLVEKL